VFRQKVETGEETDMRVFVAGATGALGKRLVPLFVSRPDFSIQPSISLHLGYRRRLLFDVVTYCRRLE
jgi:hypothetical protein